MLILPGITSQEVTKVNRDADELLVDYLSTVFHRIGLQRLPKLHQSWILFLSGVLKFGFRRYHSGTVISPRVSVLIALPLSLLLLRRFVGILSGKDSSL